MVYRRGAFRKKPTGSRHLAAALAVCLCLSTVGVQGAEGVASGSTALTEEEAIHRALTNPSLADLRAGWVGEVNANGLDKTAWQNPSLSYTREQLLGSNVLGEDYLTLSQQFDISGRKALARRAAKERREAAEHSADAVVVEFKAEVRRRFYRMLHAQQREASLAAWRERVEARLDAVTKREAAGDAAAYDRVRLQQELTNINARTRRERAARAKSWALLRALLDEDVRDGRGPTAANIPRLEGHILPARSKAAKREVVERTTERPTAKAHEAEGRALRLDARASSRWWVPNPSIGGGYKGVDLGGGARAHGFVFTLSVPIPAVDRQRGDRTRAAARSQSLGAQASLAANEASGQAAGLWEEVVLLSRASETLAEEGTTQSAELITAAEAAYVGGEIGVMELLDAYRSATNTDLSVLELAMDARLAEIDLSRLTEVQS